MNGGKYLKKTTVVIDIDEEINKLQKQKEKLIDKFIVDAEKINGAIEYLKNKKKEVTQ